MDPLVRAALSLQHALSRAAGTSLTLGFAAYGVYWSQRGEPPSRIDIVVGGFFALILLLRLRARLRLLHEEECARIDWELFAHLSVGAVLLVTLTPGGLDGPFYPLLYALLMLAAGFAKPLATVGTAMLVVVLELALRTALNHDHIASATAPHALLIAAFSGLNLWLFRAEISRIRALSRDRIETELQRMKESARSYRLLQSVASESESRPIPSDNDRLLQSGVEEIHEAMRFALELLRRTLSLRTVALLWLDSAGSKLHVQELATDDESLRPGPFGARDGLVGAALSQGAPVTVTGAKASAHAVYYDGPRSIGAICAVPLLERGHARGVLVADRVDRQAFSQSELELLSKATSFLLRAIQNERVFVQLERAKAEQGKLYRAAGLLAKAITEADVINVGVSSAREFTSFDFAAVTLFDRGTAEHEICAASGDDSEALVGQRFRHNAGLVSMVVANRHALPYRGDYDPARQVVFTRKLSPPGMPSLLVVPLVVHQHALGTLVLGSRKRGAFGEVVRQTLEVLASHMAVSLSNARMLKRLEELATTDGLTGLLNKRALIEMAGQKIKSAGRFHKPLSVLVCDIDHFKKVNDTYGHDVGDVVIRGLADVLRRVKRGTDIVGRFGGEEFVIVCEETDATGACLLAERVRTELMATSFATELGPLSVTCSVGVAPFPTAGESWETLFKATDEALYASKRAGRNRVTVWSPKLHNCAA